MSSLPNKWSRRRPRQKCSIIWNISVGFSVLPRGGYRSVTDQLNRHEYLLYCVVRENIQTPPPRGYSEGRGKIIFHIIYSLHSRRLEVVGTRKKRAREKGTRVTCLPRARPFSLSRTPSKRLLRRLHNTVQKHYLGKYSFQEEPNQVEKLRIL